jgi:hypothetical protein
MRGRFKMVSVTIPVSEDFKEKLKHFQWVNWSQIAREETMKKIIFEKYLRTKQISDDDWKVCESLDWHPVDELPFREDFLEKHKQIKKEKSLKIDSISQIFK